MEWATEEEAREEFHSRTEPVDPLWWVWVTDEEWQQRMKGISNED